jgi:hypothetical protein
MSPSIYLNRGALVALRNHIWLVVLAMSACALSACGAADQGSEPELGELSQALSPAPWTDADIGAVGPAGSSTLNSGTFTVQGAGADIWGTADGFHYVYQRLNGNTQVIARVASLSNTNAWAKAGIMIRDTLKPNAKNAFIAVTPGNGVTFQTRATTGGSSVSSATAGFAAPYWIKLARSGNRFSAYRSPDGVTWTSARRRRSTCHR